MRCLNGPWCEADGRGKPEIAEWGNGGRKGRGGKGKWVAPSIDKGGAERDGWWGTGREREREREREERIRMDRRRGGRGRGRERGQKRLRRRSSKKERKSSSVR